MKSLFFNIYSWIKDLYSRWSFNLFIWYSFRMVIRFLIAICSANICKFFNIPAPTDFKFIHWVWLYPILSIPTATRFLLIASIPLWIKILEDKKGFRLNFFVKSNKIFIPYFLLSIPAMAFTICFVGLVFVMFIANIFLSIWEPNGYKNFEDNLDYLRAGFYFF